MNDERDKVFQQILGLSGGPAFVRRGRDVQAALDAAVATCRQQRDEWLTFVRLALGTLYALAGSTPALAEFLKSPDQLQTLENLRNDLQPCLRLPPAPTSRGRVLARALAEVRSAVVQFNRRWGDFIAGLNLQRVNEIRERYNTYYLLEKECALGSIRVARSGFQKLDPLRPEDFLKMLPLLPVP